MRIFMLMLVGVSLIGCSSRPDTPPQWQSDHSLAYNVAQAGGIRLVQDKKIPKAEYDGLSFAYDTTFNSLLFNNSAGLGLSAASSLGLGLLTSMFSPKSPESRNSIMAWMPANIAASPEEAQKKLNELFFSALKKIAKPYDETVYQGDNGDYLWTNLLANGTWGCPDPDIVSNSEGCYIGGRIGEADRVGLAPSFVNAGTTAYQFYAGDDYGYSRPYFNTPENTTFPQDQLLLQLSAELPAWVYMYIAKGNVTINGKTIKASYVLNQGTPHLFIVPEG